MKWTEIEWTGLSSNALKYRDNNTGEIVWACEKVSEECQNCYAESIAIRFGCGGPYTRTKLQTLTPFLDYSELKNIVTKRTLDKRPIPDGTMMFPFDMTDVFGDWVTDEMLDQVFATFWMRPGIIFQVLTKRPERMAAYTKALTPDRVFRAASAVFGDKFKMPVTPFPDGPHVRVELPLANVWLGTTAGLQKTADERIPHLLDCEAAVRFVSAEPLLGMIDPSPYIRGIDWIIGGGESGRNSRPMNPTWIRHLRNECVKNGVAFFFKQWGEFSPVQPGQVQPVRVTSGIGMDEPTYMYRTGKKASGRLLDGRTWDEYPKR